MCLCLVGLLQSDNVRRLSTTVCELRPTYDRTTSSTSAHCHRHYNNWNDTTDREHKVVVSSRVLRRRPVPRRDARVQEISDISERTT